MKIKSFAAVSTVFVFILFASGCSSPADKAPAAPSGIKAVQDFIKGKKLAVKKLGFYDNLTVNGETEVKWLDLANEKDKTTKGAVESEMGLALQFVNDTAVIILKEGKTYSGTYAVDDAVNESGDENPGLKLRITYPDPEFSFDGTAGEVTYTYAVLGIDDKRIMLQTPRSINRQKLISLMSE